MAAAASSRIVVGLEDAGEGALAADATVTGGGLVGRAVGARVGGLVGSEVDVADGMGDGGGVDDGVLVDTEVGDGDGVGDGVLVGVGAGSDGAVATLVGETSGEGTVVAGPVSTRRRGAPPMKQFAPLLHAAPGRSMT